jgi:hypothetical protein
LASVAAFTTCYSCVIKHQETNETDQAKQKIPFATMQRKREKEQERDRER